MVDRLTNSTQNTISEDSFATKISSLTIKELTKKNGWNFNLKAEMIDISKEVYKLPIVNNPGAFEFYYKARPYVYESD